MKVRAYLAKEEDRLVPKNDAGRHKDFDTLSDDPEHIKKLCSILFGNTVTYLDYFEEIVGLKKYLKDQGIIYQKYVWKGPSIYLLWMPSQHRIVYRSDILLKRELQFMIALDEQLELNSEGKLDQKMIELS